MEEDIIQKIKFVIENHIRPGLQIDGGDIEVIDFKDNILKVKLIGACSCCPHAQMTLKNSVERMIRQMVCESILVVIG
ncbi:MAG: NifU family protein [Alphaproteobacteria bacterium]|nr:NifU family protein [Alphaproteobacteria bacterium]